MRDGSSSLVLVVRYGLSLYPHLHCQQAAEAELLSPSLPLVAGGGGAAGWLEELAVPAQVEVPAGAEVSTYPGGTLTFSPGTTSKMLVL